MITLHFDVVKRTQIFVSTDMVPPHFIITMLYLDP